MSRPTDGTPASRAPRLAASMIPGPPPVMIAEALGPVVRAMLRAAWGRGEARRLVARMVARRARRPEERHRLADVVQRLEPGAQLVLDAHHELRVSVLGE